MSCLSAALLTGMPAIATVTAAMSLPHQLIGTVGAVLMVWLAVSIPIGMLVGHLALDDD
jgi:hypothetical protein